ncbi:MAG: hypothetical protein IIB53_01355 [Planctomycetes bacterium]|nr:hypothetical protein [Planctomycetota bacterium]
MPPRDESHCRVGVPSQACLEERRIEAGYELTDARIEHHTFSDPLNWAIESAARRHGWVEIDRHRL